jgi:hypothetical protein
MFPPAVLRFFQAPTNGKKTIDYFAELIRDNGGVSEVTDPSILGIEKAFHLTQLVNFLKGILFAIGSPDLEFDVIQFVKREVEHAKTGSLLYLPTVGELEKFS